MALVRHLDRRVQIVAVRPVGDLIEGISREPGVAVIVPGDREAPLGVAQLLEELAARGVTIRRLSTNCW
jgi:hypothetical protein